MLSIEELEKYPEYWLEEVQNKLYFDFKKYMDKHELNQTKLAEKLGYSKGYISQIMSGKFNHSIRKYIELSLAIDMVPILEFQAKKRKETNVRKDVKVIVLKDYWSVKKINIQKNPPLKKYSKA